MDEKCSKVKTPDFQAMTYNRRENKKRMIERGENKSEKRNGFRMIISKYG